MVLDTRHKFIEIASRLFAKFGFHKTSMDEIAKISHKAKGSLYYHFPSKEDLFKEVVATEFESLKSQLNLVIHDTTITPPEKLKMYLLKRMELLSQAKNYHETLQADFYEHFSFLDSLRNELMQWEKTQLKHIIQEGVQQGIFLENIKIDVALDILMLVLKGLEIPFFLQNKFQDYAPHFDDLLSIILRGIKA